MAITGRHEGQRRRPRGVLLITSIVVALVMMLWVVAALVSAKSQTSAVLQSHRKSKARCLAKAAMSCSIYSVNVDPGWVVNHAGRAQAWTGMAGAQVWSETADGRTILRCEADVEGQTSSLSVPLLRLEDRDTEVLSVTTSTNGHDLIAKNSVSATGWQAFPPIPGLPEVVSAAGADNGDIFAVTRKPGGGSLLWRYRPGRGWIEMPDLPSGVEIEDVAIAKTERLVARGSDNRLLVLPLDASLEWRQHDPPSGVTQLDMVTIPLTDSSRAYALADNGTSLWSFTFPSSYSASPGAQGTWSSVPLPSGATDLNGGLGAGPGGELYLAANPPGQPSVVYRDLGAGWEPLPPIPFHQWQGTGSPASGMVSQIRDLKVDETGFIWIQAQDPSGTAYSNLRLEN